MTISHLWQVITGRIVQPCDQGYRVSGEKRAALLVTIPALLPTVAGPV